MQLPPCKRCGHPNPWWDVDQVYDEPNPGDFELYSYVECPRCKARTPAFYEEEDAAKAWASGVFVPCYHQRQHPLPNGRLPDNPLNLKAGETGIVSGGEEKTRAGLEGLPAGGCDHES